MKFYVWVKNFMQRFEEVGLWGVQDANGDVIVPPKYDRMDLFREGLARVKLNGKWGFIDTEGKEVVPAKYDDTCMFYGGFVKVLLNGKVGLVDTSGKEYFGTPEKQAFLATLSSIPCWEGLFAFIVEHQGTVKDYFSNHPRGEKDKIWCNERKKQ